MLLGQRGKKRRIRRGLQLMALALACVMMFGSIISGHAASTGQYPDYTSDSVIYAQGEVKLEKSAQWTDAARTAALVDIKINGLEQISLDPRVADVLFVLDNSGSMSYQGGCVNPDHKSYAVYKNTYIWQNTTAAHLGISKTRVLELVQDAIDNGFYQGSFDPAMQSILPKDLLIKIPAGDCPADKQNLFLYPIYADYSAYQYNSTPSNTYMSEYAWGVVDFDAGTASAYHKDAHMYPYKWYHMDGSGERLAVSVSSDPVQYMPHWELFTDTVNPATGNPVWWDITQHYGLDCKIPSVAVHDALSDFAQDMLAANPGARIAMTTFSNTAQTSSSLAKLDFTSSFTDVAQYLENTFSVNTDSNWTNYEAGLRSAQGILANDSGLNNGHKKAIVFVTDGMPNHVCIGGDMTQMDNANYSDQPQVAFSAANQVADAIKQAYPDVDIYTASYKLANRQHVNNYLMPLQTDRGSHFYIDDYTNAQNQFVGAFNDIYATIVEKTKVVTITDLIDNRYYMVDRDTLLARGYVPTNCSVRVANQVVDGQNVELVTFTYTVGAAQNTVESVKIPLFWVQGSVAPNMDGYYPTNYDPQGSGGGAKCKFLNLSGHEDVVETERVWLQRGTPPVPPVSSPSPLPPEPSVGPPLIVITPVPTPEPTPEPTLEPTPEPTLAPTPMVTPEPPIHTMVPETLPPDLVITPVPPDLVETPIPSVQATPAPTKNPGAIPATGESATWLAVYACLVLAAGTCIRIARKRMARK